ncbi:zinc-dependent alcohol dehydrogenase family protein [Paenibacillus terricola]|uniref:zinc-dependent alcohol dehydrogenase family protein n=1 Tax=Paenibacillus terricola TaxID=2763503 RepID=UPI0029648891|nr:zinc-dependent alcohol dehydrogenase family protein [Paenibacillus terricola]
MNRAPASLDQDEVLVRMLASPINPSDLIPIRGAYKHRIHLPAIPGYEGVGVVEEVGSPNHVSLLGRRVLPLRGEGTWQAYVTTKAQYAIPVPDSVDDETASQMYINPVTTWVICSDELKLTHEDVLLVNACGSAIGRLFAQFARLIGFKLIAIVRNSAHAEELHSLGAWQVLDSSQGSIRDRVMEITSGVGATAGIDSIGGADAEDLMNCIRPGGTVLSIGLLSGISIDWMNVNRQLPSINVKPYWLKRWMQEASHAQWHSTFEHLFHLLMNNQIKIQQARGRFELDEYHAAISAAEQRGQKGKVLLLPSMSNDRRV